MEYKESDWCFFEYKLSMIKRIDGEKIKAVSDGYCETSSFDCSDRVFPIDIRSKVYSDMVSDVRTKLHNECHFLNFPDIHNWLVDKWVLLMEVRNNDDKAALLSQEIRDFERAIQDAVRDKKGSSYDGVSIFRGR